jgi:hypothetical protein
MLPVTDGCTESQFPLVPKAVLVCWYDVIGTSSYDYRASVTHPPRCVSRANLPSDPGEKCACSDLFDPDEMIPSVIVATASTAPVSSNCP